MNLPSFSPTLHATGISPTPMLLQTFLQDIRIGLRVLIKEKSYCALAVAVLALGIGAVATQFAITSGILLHTFTFRDAEQLVDVTVADPSKFAPDLFNTPTLMTPADFADLREQQKSFSDIVGYIARSTVNLTWNGQPKRLEGGYISHDFFRVLGVAPALGRDFLPEDDREGVEKAVLLSDALWRSDFGADPSIIGQTARINGQASVIIGVMPPKFSFPFNEQLWLPLNTEYPVKPRGDPSNRNVGLIARLKPGIGIEQASAEVTSIAQGLAAAHPATNKPFTLGYVRPLNKALFGAGLAGLLYTMLGFCVGVLLIACVNVMNMQFARSILRARELAVRSSLGATRWRLLRQMLTESLLVATLGAGLGVILAYWATDWFDASIRSSLPFVPSWMTFAINAKVLASTVAATVLATVVSGLVPAWLSSRANAVEALRDSSRGNTGRTLGLFSKSLVVFQIAVTCVLLIAALLQLQTIINLQRIDFGYDTGSVTGARITLFGGNYPTPASRRLFYDKVLRELRASPELAGAALTNRVRMIFSGSGPIEIEGRQYASDGDRTVAQFENVSAGYHEVLGQKLIEGRHFIDVDSDQRQPVAVVNATFARKHFGSETAIGRRFRLTAANGARLGPWRTIIGVVTDVRMLPPYNPLNHDNAGFYVPYFATAFGPVAAQADAPQSGTIVAKPRGGARGEAAAQAVREALRKVDPDLPPYFVDTPKVSIERSLGASPLIVTMFIIFGLVAATLASVGLYGVMSSAVNQRTQEFGIRMALGADGGSVLRLVLRQGAWQLGAGLAFGLGATFLIGRLGAQSIQDFLTGISPTDPRTYTAVALLLSVVSLVAIYVPARRATRVDPMTALRAE
jgi:predicted permease